MLLIVGVAQEADLQQHRGDIGRLQHAKARRPQFLRVQAAGQLADDGAGEAHGRFLCPACPRSIRMFATTSSESPGSSTPASASEKFSLLASSFASSSEACSDKV